MKNNIIIKYICFLLLLLIIFSNTSYAITLTSDNLENLEKIILEQLYSRKDSFNIKYTGTSNGLEDTLNEIFKKDMYIKSTVNYYSWSYEGFVGNIDVNINANHIITNEEELLIKVKINEILGQIISPEMNTHEKIKAVNDWIVLNSKYDSSLNNNSHYDLLYKGNSVCNGYALLTYEMLKKLNIPVMLITGYSKNQSHIWNMVKIDNYWFHLDTTWNDPLPDKEGIVSYDYYLLSDDEIKLDHTYDNKYPVASKSYYNYLYELINSSNEYYRFIRLAEDLNLNVYFKENTVDTYDKFKEVLSFKTKCEPNYIMIRCSESVVEEVIKHGLTTLYNNNNIQNIKYSVNNDKTGNYKLLELFIEYKKIPDSLTTNINKDIYIKGNVIPLNVMANYTYSSIDVTSSIKIRPYNETIISYCDGKLNMLDIGKSILEFKYCNKNITIPISVFNDKSLKYILDNPPSDDIKVRIFGKYINFDQPPIIESGRTLVPVRAIFEVLGLKVDWNNSTKTVSGVIDNTEITLTIDDTIAYINNTPYKLDVPPRIVNDRTLVPIRFVSEALKRNVFWDNSNKSVIIN